MSTIAGWPDTETLAFALRLRPGSEAEYRRRHDAIWPEMAQALRDAGILHYEIHLSREADLLVGTPARIPLEHMFTLRPNRVE
jgi:L-rhamnose mutarotase